jgi:hypothetical protein
MVISGLNHAASASAVYASSRALPHAHARLASGRWLAFAGWELNPLDSIEKFLFVTSNFLLSQAYPGATCKNLPQPWCKAIVSIPETERLNIQPARPRGNAQRTLRRRPARLREIGEPRRTQEIASLLSSLAPSQSDAVLQLVEMRINEL